MAQALSLSAIEVTIGRQEILKGVDLAVAPGTLVTLLGPSGCGKTTLLKVIAGLYRGHRGSVVLAGTDVTQRPPYKRNVGVVFQNYALFPHLSVFDNVAFGVRLKPDLRPRLRELVMDALELVHLTPMADRSVAVLSGGQQQRVAVARSLVVQPSILLLDEPFSALDRQLREEMQIELRQILRRQEMTTIFVTHDQEEALVMSDRIVVMREGEIEQEAEPVGLYESPQSIFVLDFIGKSVRLAGRVLDHSARGSVVQTALGNVTAPTRFLKGSMIWVGVRADRVVPTPVESQPDPDFNYLPRVLLKDVINNGATRLLLFEGGPEDRLHVQTLGAGAVVRPGGACGLSWRLEDTLCFPRERGE